MGSGAGLNRVGQLGGKPLITFATTATAYTTPFTGYGTIGVNDSGPIMWEAIGFKTWSFQHIGGSTGYSVSIYGTIDPALYKYLDTVGATQGVPNPYALATAVPASSWFLLPSPAENTGTGTVANPMVSGTSNFLQFNGTLVAVRAVLTATTTPTGTGTVVGFATP